MHRKLHIIACREWPSKENQELLRSCLAFQALSATTQFAFLLASLIQQDKGKCLTTLQLASAFSTPTLGPYCVPATVLGDGDAAVNKTQQGACPHGR